MSKFRKHVVAVTCSFALLLISCSRPMGVTTATQQSRLAAAGDCWVHIFEDENFRDNNDLITAPGRYANMRGLPGAAKQDWGDEIDSIRMGARARATFWEDENFGDNRIQLTPGQERNNLRGEPDMGDQIDSMELTCS